jgi:hypothetical protein
MPKFTLYHESNHEFGFPDLTAMKAHLTGHNNGGLGLWTSVLNEPPRGEGLFGTHLYRIVAECPIEALRIMPLAELRQFDTEQRGAPGEEATHEAYSVWREQLIEQGYKLATIVEGNSTIKQAIILDFTIIKDFQKKDRTP